MRPKCTHTVGESRLLGLNKADREKQLDQALDTATMPSNARPLSATNFGQEVDRLEKWAGTEVINVKPSISSRIARWSAGGIVDLVTSKKGAIYDGMTAEIKDAIDRQAYQRWLIAERQLDSAQSASLAKINALARDTKLSAGFLKHKMAVCESVQKDIDKRIQDANDRVKNARGFDKSSLLSSVKDLQEKLKAVKTVGSDAEKQFEGSLAGKMYREIDNATKYFAETFGAYSPEFVTDVQKMIQEYVEGKPASLENACTQTAEKMFPADPKKQLEQVQAMMRIAEKITGDQRTSRIIGRQLRDIGLPSFLGSSAGVVAGALTYGTLGAVGGALGAGIPVGAAAILYKIARNYYKHGNASRTTFERQQAGSYINEQAVGQINTIRTIKLKEKIADRIMAVKEMKPGAKFSVSFSMPAFASADSDLTIVSNNGTTLLATTKNGTTVSFDLEGYDVTGTTDKEFAVAVKTKSATKNEHGKILVNKDATDSILTLSA